MDTITAAYLNRLGVEAEPPSAEALTRLHRAHVERVPYETFWIHLAQGWGIDAAESTRRVATTRRGGYCYQLNGAFRTLLTALGYQVSVNVAGVHEAGGPDESTLRNHAALVVEGLPTDTQPRRALVGGRRSRRRAVRPDAARGRRGRAGADAVRDGRGRRRGRRRLAPDARPVRLVHRREPRRRAGRDGRLRGAGTSTTRRRPSRASRRPSRRSGVTRPGPPSCGAASSPGGDGDMVTTRTCESLHEWLDVLEGEFDLAFDDDVPTGALDRALDARCARRTRPGPTRARPR